MKILFDEVTSWNMKIQKKWNLEEQTAHKKHLDGSFYEWKISNVEKSDIKWGWKTWQKLDHTGL